MSKPVTILIQPADTKAGQSRLMDTIAGTYTDSSDDWTVFDMAAYSRLKGKTPKTSDKAKQAYLDKVIPKLASDSLATANPSDRAKAEIVMAAIGVDSTKLKEVNGTAVFDNGAKLKKDAANVAYYTAPYVLLADEAGNVKLDNSQIQSLISTIVSAQGADGIAESSYAGQKYQDIDSTGIALAAFARFYNKDSRVTSYVDKAVAGLKKVQKDNGSYGNVNTDAIVITGLAALGYDPTGKDFTKNGNSLADSLSLYINDKGDGFVSQSYSANPDKVKESRALATEQGFRALVVLEKLKESGTGAYNIYTNSTSKESRTPGTAEEKPGTGGGAADPSQSGGNAKAEKIKVSLTVSAAGSGSWLDLNAYEVNEGSSVKDVLVNAFRENGITCNIDNGYIKSVTKDGKTLGEFTGGPYSGWMYKVNGKNAETGISDCIVKNGDSISLFYTNDYRKEDPALAEDPAGPAPSGKDVKQEQKPAAKAESGKAKTKTFTLKVKAVGKTKAKLTWTKVKGATS